MNIYLKPLLKKPGVLSVSDNWTDIFLIKDEVESVTIASK